MSKTETEERKLLIELTAEERKLLDEAAVLTGISPEELCRVAIRRHCRAVRSYLSNPGEPW